MYDFELLELARRRYPKEAPDFAVFLFTHDRAAAGLGALGNRPEVRGYDARRGLQISRRKWRDFETDDVIWKLDAYGRYYENCMPRLALARRGARVSADLTMTRRLIDVNLAIKVRIPRNELRTQDERDIAAQQLRDAKRQLREAVRATLVEQRS